jgi:hypothetical protein
MILILILFFVTKIKSNQFLLMINIINIYFISILVHFFAKLPIWHFA